MTHELGHPLGLKDITTQDYSIIMSYATDGNLTAPTAYDADDAKYIWDKGFN